MDQIVPILEQFIESGTEPCRIMMEYVQYCFHVLRLTIYDTCYFLSSTYLSRWITIQSCDMISMAINWTTAVLLSARVLLLITNLIGQFLNWLIKFVFVRSSEAGVNLLSHVVGRIFKSIWWIITFIPRSLWNMLVKR